MRAPTYKDFNTIYFNDWEQYTNRDEASPPPVSFRNAAWFKNNKKKQGTHLNSKITDLFLNVYFTWYQSRARSSRFIYILSSFEVTWSREDTKCTILLEWQSIREKGSRERAALKSWVLFFFLVFPNPIVIVVMHYIGTAKTSALLQ